MAWMVRHSGNGINRYQVGSDGKNAVKRGRGRDFKRDVAEFWGICDVFEIGIGGKGQGRTSME